MTSPNSHGQRARERAEQQLLADYVARTSPVLAAVAGRIDAAQRSICFAREDTAPASDTRRRVDALDAQLRDLHRRASRGLGGITVETALAEADSIGREARALRGGSRP